MKAKLVRFAAAGLKTKAIWKHVLPLDAPILQEATKAETGVEFITRVKREFAERNGVDVSMVAVEFRIVSELNTRQGGAGKA